MSLSQDDFTFLRQLIQQRSAIVLETDKVYLAETRLLPLARQGGFESVNELVGHLRRSPSNGLHQQVVEAMAINETSFFRDGHPFEALRDQVLPELLRRRAGERALNIWCGACSSGQEPYSVAMLLQASFPPLENWTIRLIASDLSSEMVDRGRSGRYSRMEVNRGLPPALLLRYFQKEGDMWRVKESLRRMVEFHPLNLIDSWPALPQLDLVLLRNVLIYFDAATKKQILGKIRRLLRPDGYLFLGGAETTFNLDGAFERVQFGRAGCYRQRPEE